MAPITPHWQQPSHPDIQDVVVVNEAEFTTKSLSRVALSPFALFARFDFPPCTEAPEPTYATVQMGRNRHLNLNSDLLYINHSCEPSLVSENARSSRFTATWRGLSPPRHSGEGSKVEPKNTLEISPMQSRSFQN